MNRTVRLPEKYWRVIDREAKRCKRSGERQLEALLSRVFGFENVNIEIDDEGVLVNRKASKRRTQTSLGTGGKKTRRNKQNVG